MNDIFIDLGFSTLFTLLKSLKGEKKKAQFKKVFLKLRNAIDATYSDDPDFD